MDASESYYLGIDIGTSNVKVVLVDSGLQVVQKKLCPLEVLETVSTPNESELPVGHIFTALETCIQSVEGCEQIKKVKAIGVCGQMHGCVLWNSHGLPLFNESLGKLQHNDGATSNLYTWQDGRCTPAFLSSLPSVVNQSPPISAGHGCATLAWLQQNGDSLSKFDRAGTIMDMLVCALCSGGRSSVIMSSQNAASWGYFDISASQWYKEILETLFPISLLPTVVSVPAIAGHLMAQWHNIPQGTVVGVAMGDMQCAVYAAQPSVSDAVLNIGTASQLILRKAASLTNEPPLPESVMKVPYFNDDYLLVVAALGGGNVISTFVRTVQSWLQELGMECGETEMYEKLMQAALNKCNTSLRVIPKLWGERHTPEERGQVLNIRPDNISLGDVGSAMVRGVVENLHTMMTLQVLQDYQVQRVLGSGGMLQKYSVFQEHIRQVFGLSFTLKDEADAPLGAAMAVKHL